MNTKPQQKQRRGVVQISEVAIGLIDPVLAKRAGINTMLLGSWDEIAGAEFAECTRPERIAWPRRSVPGLAKAAIARPSPSSEQAQFGAEQPSIP